MSTFTSKHYDKIAEAFTNVTNRNDQAFSEIVFKLGAMFKLDNKEFDMDKFIIAINKNKDKRKEVI